ncbi:MAG TPA: LysR family transcriptional regulator [Candidatus Lachnoclostridium stercorigallinarum]|uniref:LysR family transcriptional regulator n=1 Tax=Candidatus Lachnoclostridium stercorigallinarum TaxID=2838634 RepID=A0A9D2K6S6_9FIRM|nr:LysR family transcriptional regulator [Candidatus Lachnoclostridium stercorigallinarum]
MKIKQLYTFRTVCEEESITKAAERLSTTQPAISRTISELEESLGTQLFDRTARKIVLNDAGQLFLSKVIPLLELYEDLQRGFGNHEVQYELKIGATPSVAASVLFRILEKFRSSHEEVRIRVTVDNETELEQLLIHRKIDMALTEGMTDDEHFVKVPVSSEPLSILCSPDFPAAATGELTVQELARQPLLLKESGSMIRRIVDSAFLFYDVAVTPVWTSTSSAVLLKAAREGMGIAILPGSLAEQDLQNGTLTEIAVADFNLDCTTHVTFLQDKYQTPAFQAFMNVILFSVT